MVKKLKVAIVGCGRILQKHIEAISYNSTKFTLVALCDTDQTKLVKFKNKKIILFKSLDELLLAKINFDLISICTPSSLHSSQTIQCLKKNFNVLVEKPMSLNFKDAKKMILMKKKNKKKLFVSLQNRFNPTVRLLKKIISQKKLGKIYLVNINVFWNRSQNYYDADAWRGTVRHDGGALMNQSIHFLDLVLWLFGKVKKLQVMRATLARKIEVEDTALINFFFKNNIFCSFSTTMLTHNTNYEGSITVLGEKGIVKIGGVALNKIIDWNINGKEMTEVNKNKINYKLKSVYGSGHKYLYKEIFNSITKKNFSAISAKDGSKSVEIIDKIYRCSKLLSSK